MKTMIMPKNTLFFSSAIIGLSLTTGLSAAYAGSDDEFGFLLRFHPKISTSMVVTGPEHVERVRKHSLVFSPKQTRKVLLTLDKFLTKHKEWTRHVAQQDEYVVYRHKNTFVSYMSARVYRQLNWDSGTKLLPTKKGGCVVEYFRITE